MSRRLVSVAVSVLVLGIAHGLEWVPFESGQPEQAPEFRVLSSNSFRTVVELELAGMYVDEVEANGRTFQAISLGIEAGGMTREEGAPRLPVVARFLRIPDDRAVEVNVLELEELVLEGYEVYPTQPPLPENETSVPFVLNEKRYATDAFYPDGNERVSEPMIMRDFRLVQLVLQPARFNPVTGELRMARSLRVELVHNRPGAINVKQRNRSGISRAFEPLYRRLIANYDFGPPQQPEDGSYLIITHDDFASAVVPFAEWKRRKGWRTVVVTTSDIGGNDSAHIDAYVTDAYNNWPYPPDYVLLVGDAQDYLRAPVYHFDDYYYATDLYYSLKEGGDILADLMIGRVCVKTPVEAQTALNKLFEYEMQPYIDNPDWFGKACGTAGYEGGHRFWTVVIRIRDYVMGRPFIQFDTLFQRWNLNQCQGLIDSLNRGRSWVVYRGHGGRDGWYNVEPPFRNSEVLALDNGRMTPIVIGPTCQAADFDEPGQDCMAETWVKAGSPDSASGGVGYFGSSEVSFSGYNDSLAAGSFIAYVDSLLHTFAQCTQWAKLFMLETYPLPDPFAAAEIIMFNNLGEPELNVWSAVPQQLVVSHPAVVLLGSFPFEVTVNASDGYAPVANALVCVMSRADTTVYHVGYTDAAGRVQFTLNTDQPGDSILVTATGRNLHPYLGSAVTIPPNSPYVIHLGHTVNDSGPGGNGDGIINPGETVKLPMWVKNLGLVAADSVYGMLSSGDVSVTMLDSVRLFGTIGAGDSAHTGSDGFEFSVAGACTNAYLLEFELECRDAADSVWVSRTSHRVGTAVLEFDGYAVEDSPPGGNGDGRLGRGETARLALSLRNIGLGHGYDVAAILRSGDSRLHVRDSAGGFGTIMHDSTGMNTADPFAVHADSSIPLETPIPCTLLVNAEGYSVTLPFDLIVGEIGEPDPIPDGPRKPARYWAYEDVDLGYPERPEFEWIEINGIGTRLVLADDQTVQITLPSGFLWKYYGQRYAQVSICSNGFISPGFSSYCEPDNEPLPTPNAPPLVAVNWDDLYPEQGGGVWYYHDTARHCIIIEYDSVYYSSPRDDWEKFEVILYDATVVTPTGDNVVVCQYLTANRYTSSSIGFLDQSRMVGIQYLYDGSYHQGASGIQAGRAIRYSTVPPVTGLAEESVVLTGIGRAGFAVQPNPVRDRARVQFGLRRESPVRLAVFDRSGRQVRSLVRARLKPGDYAVRWDGCDDFGRRLSQGIYFLRLEADGERLTKKAVLLQ